MNAPQTMTAGQLIAALAATAPDTPVVFDVDEGPWREATGVAERAGADGQAYLVVEIS